MDGNFSNEDKARYKFELLPLTEWQDLLYRLALYFRKSEPLSFNEIKHAFNNIEDQRLK